MHRIGWTAGLFVLAIPLRSASLAAPPAAEDRTPPIVVEVVAGSEQSAQVPVGWYLPDEHTSFVPLPGHPGTFLAFTGVRTAAPTNFSGALVMTTTDLLHFDDAAPAGYFSPVMTPLEPSATRVCTPGIDGLFDDNYAAPGSVFPDPASPGTWLMLYEAENHCRNDVHVAPFYASVGVARSFNQGESWPAAAFQSAGYDSRLRYEAVSSQLPKPTNDFSYAGDAIPSGFASDGFVYAYYADYIPGNGGTKHIEVARARDDGQDPMTFWKFSSSSGWAIPASTRDGAVTGAGSALVTPPDGYSFAHVSVHEVQLEGRGAAPEAQGHLFVMIMECDNRVTAAAAGVKPQGAWFYATTSDLERQTWSAPALIANTQQYQDCASATFDGWYPSLVSPNAQPGRLGERGRAVYLNGDVVGPHTLAVRDFQIRRGRPAPFTPLPTVACP